MPILCEEINSVDDGTKKSVTWRHLVINIPDDEVDADNTLWLVSATVVDDGTLGLHPGVPTTLGEETVITGDSLATRKHCERNKGGY